MTSTSSTSRAPETRQRLAQVGLFARGVLYCLVGFIALQIAFGSGGGEQASKSGALQTIAQQTLGTLLVGLVGVGLVAYAGWRASQVVTERDTEDSDTKNAVMRVSYAVRTVIYLAFAFAAFSLAFGGGSGGGSGGSSSSQTITATIMKNVPGGVFLVGLGGLIIIGVGLYQGYQAFSDDFMEKLRTSEMSASMRRWARRIGVAGHSSRAVVYTLIGGFVVQAALQFDPQEAKGVSGALQELARQPYGPWLLALVAVGLFLYGIFALIHGRYVKVD